MFLQDNFKVWSVAIANNSCQIVMVVVNNRRVSPSPFDSIRSINFINACRVRSSE